MIFENGGAIQPPANSGALDGRIPSSPSGTANGERLDGVRIRKHGLNGGLFVAR